MKKKEQYRKKFSDDDFIMNCGYNHYESGVRLPWHSHEGMEFTYVLGGRLIWEDENGEVYPLVKSQMSLMQKGVVHRGVDNITFPCDMIWIIFRSPATDSAFSSIFDNAGIKEKQGCYGIQDALWAELNSLKLNLQAEELPEQMESELIRLQIQKVLLLSMYQISRDALVLVNPKFQEIRAYINNNFQEMITVSMLCKKFGKSNVFITKLFHQNAGMTPGAYITSIRLSYARELLKSTVNSITEIAFDSGFSSAQYFCTAFHNFYGMSPSSYRREIFAEKKKG